MESSMNISTRIMILACALTASLSAMQDNNAYSIVGSSGQALINAIKRDNVSLAIEIIEAGNRNELLTYSDAQGKTVLEYARSKNNFILMHALGLVSDDKKYDNAPQPKDSIPQPINEKEEQIIRKILIPSILHQLANYVFYYDAAEQCNNTLITKISRDFILQNISQITKNIKDENLAIKTFFKNYGDFQINVHDDENVTINTFTLQSLFEKAHRHCTKEQKNRIGFFDWLERRTYIITPPNYNVDIGEFERAVRVLDANPKTSSNPLLTILRACFQKTRELALGANHAIEKQKEKKQQAAVQRNQRNLDRQAKNKAEKENRIYLKHKKEIEDSLELVNELFEKHAKKLKQLISSKSMEKKKRRRLLNAEYKDLNCFSRLKRLYKEELDELEAENKQLLEAKIG